MGADTRYFTVAIAKGMSTVKLDSQGRGTVQYTVSNKGASAIDGRAVLESLPPLRPPNGVVEKGWVKIKPPTDCHFAIDQEQVFSVEIAVPKNSPAGDYSFRLDVVNVAYPDVGDQGTAVAFTVAAPPPSTPSKWPLIVLIIALVLAVAGVATWLILRKPSAKPTPTPTPTPTATPAPTPNPYPLGGSWVNDNPNTGSLTRLIITQDSSGVSVHAYGKCSPTDCDWGTQRGSTQGPTIAHIVWNQGFVVRNMTLQLPPTGHLTSTMQSIYTAGNQQVWVDSFHRIEILQMQRLQQLQQLQAPH